MPPTCRPKRPTVPSRTYPVAQLSRRAIMPRRAARCPSGRRTRCASTGACRTRSGAAGRLGRTIFTLVLPVAFRLKDERAHTRAAAPALRIRRSLRPSGRPGHTRGTRRTRWRLRAAGKHGRTHGLDASRPPVPDAPRALWAVGTGRSSAGAAGSGLSPSEGRCQHRARRARHARAPTDTPFIVHWAYRRHRQ